MNTFVPQSKGPIIRPRPFWHVLALAIFMLLSFSTLKYLPGMLVIQDIWTALILGGVIYFYLPFVMKRGCLNFWFEAYILMMMILAPVISALGALNEFGQPFLYGIASGRSTVLMGAGLLYMVMFRARVVDVELTRQAVVFIACVSVAGWTLLSATIDTSSFEESIPGFVENGEGGKILLDPSFIVFGFFYFTFSYFFAREKISGYFSLLFLVYLVLGMGGRMCILATLLTVIYFLWRRSAPGEAIAVGVKAFFIGLIIAIALFLIAQEKVEDLVAKFQDAAVVVVSGEEVEDVSAYARLMQKGIAEPFVQKNLLFGNGFLSNQWEGGFLGRFGYFHPGDIGVFGVVFQYGIVGFVLFLFVYFFYFYISTRATFLKAGVSPFVCSGSAMMMYWAIYSISTGWFAFSVEQLTIVLCMLICFSAPGRKIS